MKMQYRRLEKGEIIQEGDEVDGCANPWHDDPVWVTTENIGIPAPDPQYPAHPQYRRPIQPCDSNDKETSNEINHPL